jgi:hypothetical protein
MWIGLFLLCFWASANPFLIDMKPSKDESCEFLEKVQLSMSKIDVREDLELIYPVQSFFGKKFNEKEDFYRRAMRGAKQTLIDISKGLYPKKELVEVNGGGSNCVVLSCPIHPKYEQLLLSLIEALKEIGFKGAIYYRIGGFPNPTGEEVRYVAVPYSFKIFTMIEAYQLGYKNILWLDASVYPLQNLELIFQKIRDEGAVISWKKFRRNGLLPKTEKILFDLTGYEPGFFEHVSMQVFGLRMDLPWVQDFIEDYYKMVRLGTPFISCYPEEHVISSLAYKYRNRLPQKLSKIILPCADDNRVFVDAKKQGYFFFLRKH